MKNLIQKFESTNNGWTSVNDSMPEEFEDVLVVTRHGRISIAYLHEQIVGMNGKKCTVWAISDSEEGNYLSLDIVTHWMPLPKNPNLA